MEKMASRHCHRSGPDCRRSFVFFIPKISCTWLTKPKMNVFNSMQIELYILNKKNRPVIIGRFLVKLFFQNLLSSIKQKD